MAVQRANWFGLAVSMLLAACSSGGGHVQTAAGQQPDAATTDFPIFYVKRASVPKNQDDLRMVRFAVPSADLYMRSRAAPSGTETNLTARVTGTGTATAADYDVKDVSISADGKTVLFAMRGPLVKNMQQDKAPSWRIWQYVIATDQLALVIDPTTDPDPLTVNDVAPQFLPDGRILFSSTRQRESQAVLLDEGKPQFIADDEDRNEPAFVLHVMNADGTGIHQISFNQSHDRDGTVLMNGRVMWTRWDNAPGKDGMHLYSANPDGTDLQLHYGANSHDTGASTNGTNTATIEFVKTHEMQDNRILALVRPYTGTDFGGDLVIIDANNYVENNQGASPNSGLAGPAQSRATPNPVLTIPGPSPGGRFYDGFPLWDGTGRILVTWTQCRLLDTTTATPTIVPCTTSALAAPTPQEAPPLYSLWMFDPGNNTMLPVLQPVEGIMVTDVVAAQPRTLPAVIIDKVPGVDLDQDFYNAGVGVLNIRSVYDFDGVDTAQPNIASVADPAKTTAAQRPARFIRLVKPVSLPSRKALDISDDAFGATPFMREIMAYAPVEPDGSVRIEVPANVAFQISVVDANGQNISPGHAAWIQVLPGEELKCNGCHTPAAAQNAPQGVTAKSHGRANLFNAAWAGASATGMPFPNTVPGFSPNAGETMAETRSRTSCANDVPRCQAMVPSVDVTYTDVWTNTAAGLTANPPINYSYRDPSFTTPVPLNLTSCKSAWQANCRIVINYTEEPMSAGGNIQPLWDKPRPPVVVGGQDHTCNQAGCHNPADAANAVQVPAGQLDLTAVAAQDVPVQLVSYRKLLFPHNEQQVNMGALVDVLVPGPIDPTTGLPTQVPVTISPAMLAGNARGSRFFGKFANGGTHAGWLSPAELRLLSEWLDIGAQYFNNPFDADVPLN